MFPGSSGLWNQGPAGAGGLLIVVRHEGPQGDEVTTNDCIMQGRVSRVRRAHSGG